MQDLVIPQILAKPVVVAGKRGMRGWYTSAVTIQWNWSTQNIQGVAGCVKTTTAPRSGRILVAASCVKSAEDLGSSFVWVSIDRTQPAVRVTGVRNGRRYVRGHVPVAGCLTADKVSGVGVKAKLKVTSPRSRLGKFTATCSGAISVAGTRQKGPVRVTYIVVR